METRDLEYGRKNIVRWIKSSRLRRAVHVISVDQRLLSIKYHEGLKEENLLHGLQGDGQKLDKVTEPHSLEMMKNTIRNWLE